ncbi:MAG: hypothetical protein O2923_08825 [Verrucomicrobia bacterium]|nr:hypothetical protein [Verrucomicrobiota bacterium]MDA1087365.1 hypothetical protein [Verrucomicrobiota bacterium]
MVLIARVLCALIVCGSLTNGMAARAAVEEAKPAEFAQQAATLGLKCVALAQACETYHEIALKALENATAANTDAALVMVEARGVSDKDAAKRAQKLKRAADAALADCRDTVEDITRWHTQAAREAERAQAHAKLAMTSESVRGQKSALAKVKRSLRKIEALEARSRIQTDILKKRWLLMQGSLLPIDETNTIRRIDGIPVTIPLVTPVGNR